MSTAQLLDKIFDPMQDFFDASAAARVVAWQADQETQSRLDSLAEKSSEGTLSSEEREEYDTYIRAIDFIGILQAKARAVLRSAKS